MDILFYLSFNNIPIKALVLLKIETYSLISITYYLSTTSYQIIL